MNSLAPPRGGMARPRILWQVNREPAAGPWRCPATAARYSMPAFMGFCNVPFSVAGCNRRHSSHHCRWQFRRDSASHVHAADVVRGTSMAQRRGMAAALPLWLADYRVVVEGRVIEGLSDDVSALTYDPDRKTLFTVTNKSPELIELSLDGRVLRHIACTVSAMPKRSSTSAAIPTSSATSASSASSRSAFRRYAAPRCGRQRTVLARHRPQRQQGFRGAGLRPGRQAPVCCLGA